MSAILIGEEPTNVITLTVYGKAVTQGSKTARSFGGKAWVVDGSAKKAAAHKDWRAAVADAARQWQEDHGTGLITGPVIIRATFFLPKPASAPKRRRTWPVAARSGDLDKLCRSILDSLTNTILADDSQAVGLLAMKDFGDPPRVEIHLFPLPDETVDLLLTSQVLV